jgi:glycosyltransferase involved in cell wall biosynthesis
MKVIYITRSDISWYSRNANAYQKPLMLSEAFELTLVCPEGTKVPEVIAEKCRVIKVACGEVRSGWSAMKVARFMKGAWMAVFCYCKKGQKKKGGGVEGGQEPMVATGFDFPCLMLGWWAKRRRGSRWGVFCWDPPALSWRDKVGVLARGVVMGVDWLFKRLVRDADRLVLNIHPGLLNEIGYAPRAGQVIRMVNGVEDWCCCKQEPEGKQNRIGIVANATEEKGLQLILDAFRRLKAKVPQLMLTWIGDKPDARWMGQVPDGVEFTGRLEHDQALEKLRSCGIAIHAYLNVPSLRWNYPLKVLEYMALGKTIVAADLPGVRDLIQDGVNGLLFKPGDVDDLCRALEKAIGNQELSNRLGVQARRDAEKYRWATLNQAVCGQL